MAEIVHYIAVAIELMAVAIIAYASIEAFMRVARFVFRQPVEEEKRATYVRYLRWLVAALTFQLAADLVHTAIAPTWEQLGHVGAIAVIRTFLGYFLERDIREAGREGNAPGFKV